MWVQDNAQETILNAQPGNSHCYYSIESSVHFLIKLKDHHLKLFENIFSQIYSKTFVSSESSSNTIRDFTLILRN